MSKLDELEKLANSSYSQSTVGIEIADLLALIKVAKAAQSTVTYFKEHNDGFLVSELSDALDDLECGE